MYKDKLDLATAKQLESIGQITIIDASPESIGPLGQEGIAWKQNFINVQSKHRHISPDKLLSFIGAKYSIEVPEEINQVEGQFTWRYLYGVTNKQILSKTANDIEYVYILVNAGYPNLVKIGMTIHDVQGRVTSINATSTVTEWVAKFALPLEKGSAYKVEQAVHKVFASNRVSSDLGGTREFFEVDIMTAIDKVREIGAPFTVGNPVIC